jgi:hypothetical protein
VKRAVASLALVLLQTACTAWEPAYSEHWQVLPPAALDTRLAFVEATNARVFLVDPARPEAPARVVPVGTAPALAVRRRGADQLLVLSRGERGGPGVMPQPASLAVIPADPGRAPTTLPLASRFTALSQSDDGRFAIAHFAPATSTGETLFNPNEIAIVDLQAGTPPVARTIRSFGGVPRQVVFSPPLALPEGPRTLAVFLSDNYVTLLDLDHPTRSEITVPLTLPDDHRTLVPLQVLFEAADPAVYVRVDRSNDIYALRLLPVPPAERADGGNDFTPALSQLAAGNAPADMALYTAADGPRLLVVSPASRDAFVIDARSSRSTRIPLDDAASRIHLFEAAGPGDPQRRPRALLIGAGLEAQSVGFLDLDQLEQQGRRNLDTRSMGAPALDSLFFPGRGLAVVLHRAQPARAGVSVIDLAHRTVSPIFAEVPPARIALGPTSERIWVSAESGLQLGFIDLGSLAPGEVRLDAPITAVLPLPRAADGKTRVVAVHGANPAGAITVLDADKPDRATARVIEGFLLQDLLERNDR